ncbi:zinc ribbon domain-containing protein [Streptomyces sp. NPDC056713]|uniref:zinc ribbon domain-containing protein n=1 Tax=Streptomyces sp. NPDC056713 TaxID=3345921 RepID=UPI0036CC299F
MRSLSAVPRCGGTGGRRHVRGRRLHRLGKANRASQARFACPSCGFVAHADRNGSHNIRHHAEELLRRGASQPPQTHHRTPGAGQDASPAPQPAAPVVQARDFESRVADGKRVTPCRGRR